ncbi:hypothetical protein SFA35_08365 [Pseudomonas sp. HR96]|uniref:hypothetical protein n=1 Tax=Pseudomonas sp. HR96 TaxID=1027966 RepID=UPI002A7633FA|nr:hypothetical protein [Pseudomonas sp. HR96]WPP01358.1 hypothetical protein SFA35_08365 [Pseudomonas sp. HR96]
MPAIARFTLLTLVLGLSACAVQPQQSAPLPPIQTLPSGTPPQGTPGPVTPPSAPVKPMPRTSASFAPPPGGASHWDPKLGVYVLEDQPDTFYRQRTYYHWNDGWGWSTSPQGPWQATDATGVPPGLGRLHP